MANLWIYASVGLDTVPSIHGSAIPYADDETVTVTCTPQINYIYDYCTVIRDTIPPIMYNVSDSAVTVTMDVRTTMTFVGHAVGDPPPDGDVFNPALLLLPVGVGIALYLAYKYV